jgi:hypothetical protein
MYLAIILTCALLVHLPIEQRDSKSRAINPGDCQETIQFPNLLLTTTTSDPVNWQTFEKGEIITQLTRK